MFQGLYSIHCAVTFCSRIRNPFCNVTTNDALQNLDLCSAFAALSLYCATPDLPWDLGFAVLAERPTASFASYNKQRVTTGQILTRIPAKQKSPLINFCYFNSAYDTKFSLPIPTQSPKSWKDKTDANLLLKITKNHIMIQCKTASPATW